MLDKKYLLATLERHRQLILDYLELNNHNLEMARQLAVLQELFQKFVDVHDVIPFVDEKLRSAVLATQIQINETVQLSLIPSKVRHLIQQSSQHLQKHSNYIQHRCETIDAYKEIVTHKLDQIKTILDENLDDDMLLLHTLQDVIGIEKLVFHYHKKILKEYQITNNQSMEIERYIEQLEHQLQQLKQYALNKQQQEIIDVLNFQHVWKVLERERVQLVRSWEKVRQDAEELEREFVEEYCEQFLLQEDIKKIEQAQSQLTPRPTLTPFVRGAHDVTEEGS